MQSLASTSAPTPFPLSEPNLRSHTSLEGIAPRRTVQIYLQSISRAQGFFDLPTDPIRDDETPPSLQTLAASPALPRQQSGHKRRKLDEEEEEVYGARDTALVMHEGGERETKGILKNSTASVSTPIKKKPSLVSAMRPRLASVNKNADTAKDGKRKKGKGEVGVGSNGEKENKRRSEQRDAKGKSKAVDEGNEKKKSDKGKGKLREEVSNEKEAAELEERLETRKERRRNKAFIRKDRSLTATATGIAAASNLKKKTTSKKREHDNTDSEDSEVGTKGKSKKEGRKSAEQNGRELVQGLERPKAIGQGRLTLKSANQLGMFNKGKASARVKVGKAVPDLAFSEMKFLNSTRPPAPSPSASDSVSSAPELELPEPHMNRKKAKNSTGRRTYGSRGSHRRRSSSKLRMDETASENSTDVDDLPDPSQALAASKKKARLEPSSPKKARRQTDHAPPPASRASSRSSRRFHDLEPEVPVAGEPRHAQRDIVDLEESNFSAHSAHSLAMRRRFRTVTAAQTEEIAEEEEPRPMEEEEEEIAHDNSNRPAEERILPPVVAPSLTSPHRIIEGTNHKTHELDPSSSIHTESIAQILRDNASTANDPDVPLSRESTSLFPALASPRHSKPLAHEVSLPHFNPPSLTRSYSMYSRSRSSSAAPCYRPPTSFASFGRQRSLSDAAKYDYVGGPLEPINPFAPTSFVMPHGILARTDPGGGSDQFIDVSQGMEEGYDAIQMREGGSEERDGKFSQPSCRPLFGEDMIEERVGAGRPQSIHGTGTALDEEVMANLWYRNVL
ncbi:uncharacterized protein JCM6883_003627 [Sporobolomyces salmoneus]|uniref:uncharacterized protein n=1 Tax=Sporobolomyces salmoneus TaxID=183962 RepID=UPI00316E882D